MKLFICVLALMGAAMADNQELLRQANDQFTSKMFSEVVKANPNKNVVLSAFSVLPPLAQLALGSEGASHDQLLKTIGLPNDNVTKEVFSLLNQQLRLVKGVQLDLANRVYVMKGYELNDDFAAVSRNVFNSDVKNINFQHSQESAKEINDWVEDHTNKRIKDLVKPSSLNSDTRAVLVNAIYFKGMWKDKFDVESTKPRDFHVSKDKTIQVPTMHRKGDYRYYESSELKAKVLEIPYNGDEASCLIVLPLEIDGLNAVLEKLKDPSALQNALDNSYYPEVDVYLPKFKIETTTDLSDVLKNVGIDKLFTPGQAELTRLLKTNEDLYISSATQKAFIEITEEGAEAAAANAFMFALSAAPSPPRLPVRFYIDKPFYYELRHKTTVLFNGVANNPAQ